MSEVMKRQAGFTAIELLITLFVAAAFLIAGYQLFNVVIKDGGQARSNSRAGNLAYDYLRRYSPSATNPCTPQTVLNNSPIAVEGLSNSLITVTISCPDYATVGLSKIEVGITYGTPEETVKYSTFVNGTGTEAPDVTEGLVAWWKFNGDATPTVGSSNGIVSGSLPTTGQNGLENGAYYFDGVDDYIDMGLNTSIGNLTNNFTVSAWINTTLLSSTRTIAGPKRTASNNGFIFWTNAANIFFSTYGVKDYTSTTSLNTGTWYFVVAVMSANDVTYYVNGVSIQTITHTTGASINSDDNYLIGATTASASSTLSSFFRGSIDDVRIYDRVLTPSEIVTLYTGGAK